MNITVLGTGNVGGTLGSRWAQKGHSVTFGSRDPECDKVKEVLQQCGENATAVAIAESVASADVIVLATPWNVAQSVLETCGDLSGKVLIDCINPLNDSFTGLDLGYNESCAERIAEWVPGAKVVKAFNTASSRTMSDPNYNDQPATMFYCGDDAEAKQIVHQLVGELDFEPVDAGPLMSARYLEPLAMLYIHLAVKEGWGSNCAFKIMKRD